MSNSYTYEIQPLSRLSMDGIVPFILDGLQWFSVEHYLLGKKFEGTLLELKVQKSKNISEARLLCVPRSTLTTEDDHIIRKITYGPDKNIPKSNWNEIKHEYLLNVFECIYEQNSSLKKQLLNIIDSGLELIYISLSTKIVSELGISGETYCKILTKVAKNISTLKHINVDRSKYGYKDEIKSTLSDQEILFIKSINNISQTMKNIEGTDKIHPEMYIDTLDNLVSLDVMNDIKDKVDGIIWTDVISKTPKFYNIIKHIEDILFDDTTPPGVATTRLKIATLIAMVIKWVRETKNYTIYSNAAKIKKSKIVISPTFRKYRMTSIPQTATRTRKNSNKIAKVMSKSIKKTWGNVSFDTLMIGITTMHFDISKYKNIISAYGGKIIDDNTVEMPSSKLERAQEMIYTIIEPKFKYDVIYYFWICRRLDLVQDIWSLVKNVEMTLSILGIKKIPKRKINNIISAELKRYDIPLDLKQKIVNNLIPSKHLIIEDNISYDECIKKFDIECGWYDATKNQTTTTALEHIYDILKTNADNTKEIISFGLILPPSLRKKAIVDLDISSKSMIDIIKITNEYIKTIKKTNSSIYKKIEDRTRIMSKIRSVGVQQGVMDVEGDVCTFSDAKWICVIANATSLSLPSKTKSTKSEDVTRLVYEKYPYSNIYTLDRKGAYTLGDVIVNPLSKNTIYTTPYGIITLISEFSAGGPKKTIDTKDARKRWFTECMIKIFDKVGNDSIAFSSQTLMDDYKDIIVNLMKKSSDDGISSRSVYILSRHIDLGNYGVDGGIDNEIERGILYTKLFKPHKLLPEQHSKLVSFIEDLDPSQRDMWLASFMKMKSDDQKGVIKRYIST